MRFRALVITLVAAAALAAAPTVHAAFGDVRTYLSQLYAGDGQAALQGYLDFPEDLDIAGDGTIYVADTMNNVVRLVQTDGTLATLAGTGAYGRVDGIGGVARFGMPEGIAVSSGGTVYVSDTTNDALRRVTASGTVSTLLTGLSAPRGLALAGDMLYIADTGSNTIKRYQISTGALTTLTSEIRAPRKIVVTPDGGTLYAVDAGNYRVVVVNTGNGAVSVIAGSGVQGYAEGQGTAAQFNEPAGIGLDASANILYVGDIDDMRIAMIRKIDLTTTTTTQWVYDQRMTSVNERSSMRVYGGFLYLAGTGTIHRYRLTDPTDNNRVAGADRYMLREGERSQALTSRPVRMAPSPDRRYWYITGGHRIVRLDRTTDALEYLIGTAVDDYVEGQGTLARFSGVAGIAVSPDGATLYVTDRYNNRLRKVDVAARTSTWLSGIGQTNSTGPGNGYAEGAAAAAKFSVPGDLTLSLDGTTLYVADTGNHRLRAVDAATGETRLIAGSSAGLTDGTGAAAKFDGPQGLALDGTGQHLFVADRNNHAIRKVRLSDGKVTTLVGRGSAGYRDAIGRNAVLNLPTYLTLDGDRLFFTDAGSHRVRLVELGTNLVKTAAGVGRRGYLNGSRLEAEFNNLGGVFADSLNDMLYLSDTWNDVIRSVSIVGTAPYTDLRPRVTAVVPRQVRNVGGVAQIDVRGKNFKHGTKVWFGATLVTGFVESSTKLAVKVPIGTMLNGHYDVRVQSLDGQRDDLLDGFWLANLNDAVPATSFPLTDSNAVRVFQGNVTTGASSAVGDLTGDGVAEILAGSGAGASPQIRILRSDGSLIRRFQPFPPSSKGGVNLAVGDVTGDGQPEILAMQDTGISLLRIFSSTGRLVRTIYPFGRTARQGGTIVVADVTGDGLADIIVAPGTGAGTIGIWNANGQRVGRTSLFPGSRAGVSIAAADVTGDGIAEIFGVQRSGNLTTRVYDVAHAQLLKSFPAFPATYKTGGTIAVGDLDADGTKEIAVGLRPGSRPFIRVFNAAYELRTQFYAFPSTSRNGVGVSIGPVTSDGINKIVAASLRGTPDVIIYTGAGRAVR